MWPSCYSNLRPLDLVRCNTNCTELQIFLDALTLVMLNKLRCHAHLSYSTNQITPSRLLIQIHILNDKQCRSRSVGFFRSQLIWIYAVCKSRVYQGSVRLGLRVNPKYRRPKVLPVLVLKFQRNKKLPDE